LQIVVIIVGVLATIASFRLLGLGLGARDRRPAEAADVSD
jgi:type II secretory pathway pseudopilin PulG